MTSTRRLFITAAMVIAGAFSAISVDRAVAASTAQELNRDANEALQNLYRTNPTAKEISRHAKAILVFPSIVKAGFVFGGAYGEGVLFDHGRGDDYYNSFTGSWGLQAGAQSYGYVVFLMTPKAIDYIHKSDGWEIGVGPTVVIVDAGAAKNLSTSTLKDDAYAFIFDQKGLMAGIALEGTKISHIRR